MPKISTIFIDVDNTLLDFNACAQDAIKKAFLDAGLTYTDDVFSTFTRHNNVLWRRMEMGEITKKELFAMRWQIILEDLGIETDISAFDKSFVDALGESHAPVEGALEALRYLASKYPVYVASNAQQGQQDRRLTLAGMREYISWIFSSDEIGFAKPSLDFFKACYEQIDPVPKEEILLIGDSLHADIVGGNGFGMQTCWYNYHREAAHESIKPDFSMTDMREILNLF